MYVREGAKLPSSHGCTDGRRRFSPVYVAHMREQRRHIFKTAPPAHLPRIHDTTVFRFTPKTLLYCHIGCKCINKTHQSNRTFFYHNALVNDVTNVWMCRCGIYGELESLFIEKSVIGFNQADYNNYKPAADMKELARQIKTSNVDPSKRKNTLSKVNAMTLRMKMGDYVVCPSIANHDVIHFGKIIGEPTYDFSEKLTFSRKVEWLGSILRSEIDTKTRYSMGSLLSIFQVKCTSDFFDKLENH